MTIDRYTLYDGEILPSNDVGGLCKYTDVEYLLKLLEEASDALYDEYGGAKKQELIDEINKVTGKSWD